MMTCKYDRINDGAIVIFVWSKYEIEEVIQVNQLEVSAWAIHTLSHVLI